MKTLVHGWWWYTHTQCRESQFSTRDYTTNGAGEHPNPYSMLYQLLSLHGVQSSRQQQSNGPPPIRAYYWWRLSLVSRNSVISTYAAGVLCKTQQFLNLTFCDYVTLETIALPLNSWLNAHQLHTKYAEGTVTLKSRLRVTQCHCKRNHKTDHTRLTIRAVWHVFKKPRFFRKQKILMSDLSF